MHTHMCIQTKSHQQRQRQICTLIQTLQKYWWGYLTWEVQKATSQAKKNCNRGQDSELSLRCDLVAKPKTLDMLNNSVSVVLLLIEAFLC